MTVEDLRRQVRKLKSGKGFDVTPDQRLAYPTSEVGEVAEEVLRLSGTATRMSGPWTQKG